VGITGHFCWGLFVVWCPRLEEGTARWNRMVRNFVRRGRRARGRAPGKKRENRSPHVSQPQVLKRGSENAARPDDARLSAERWILDRGRGRKAAFRQKESAGRGRKNGHGKSAPEICIIGKFSVDGMRANRKGGEKHSAVNNREAARRREQIEKG